MQHLNNLVFLESLQFQSIPVHCVIIDISFYYHDHQKLNIHNYNNEYAIMWPYKIPSHIIDWTELINRGKAGPVCHSPSIKTWINYFMGSHSIFLHQLDSSPSMIFYYRSELETVILTTPTGWGDVASTWKSMSALFLPCHQK